MNLLGTKETERHITLASCDAIVKHLANGEGIAITCARTSTAAGEQIQFVSNDGNTDWVLQDTSLGIILVRTKLRNRGKGTWSNVMRELISAARFAQVSITINNVEDRGTREWCFSNGFKAMNGTTGFVYTPSIMLTNGVSLRK